MTYKYLEEIGTADIAFEAAGRDLPELFTAAADATMNVMIENIDAIVRMGRVLVAGELAGRVAEPAFGGAEERRDRHAAVRFSTATYLLQRRRAPAAARPRNADRGKRGCLFFEGDHRGRAVGCRASSTTC